MNYYYNNTLRDKNEQKLILNATIMYEYHLLPIIWDKIIIDQFENRKYSHLSLNDRINIEKYYNNGDSYSKIGRKISRDRTTVSREIKRNGYRNQPSLHAKRVGQKEFRYVASTAHSKYINNKYKHHFEKNYAKFIKWSKKQLKFDVSFEVMINNFRNEFKNTFLTPSLKTLYNWYHKGNIGFNVAGFSVAKYRKKVKGTPTDGRKSIHQRYIDHNFDMDDYSVAGHYEIDTIYNGDKKGGVLTLNHRATMKLYAAIIPDRTATTINRTLRSIIKEIGPHNIKSITSDNGSEFQYSKVIEVSYDLDWYYCDPFKSGQRGQNERLNRDVRIYFPKLTFFQNVNLKYFEKCITKINNRPRRKFNGRSSNMQSVFLKRII